MIGLCIVMTGRYPHLLVFLRFHPVVCPPPSPPPPPPILQNSCTCDQVILRSAYNSFDSAWSSNVVAMLVGSFVM